jgi:hypothetical protein
MKYKIGVKQGDTLRLAPVLFFKLCYIVAVLETFFPKFEAAGIEKLMFRSMQPKPAVDGVMAASAGSLMVKPAVFVKLPLCQSAWLCTLAASPLSLRLPVLRTARRQHHPCSRHHSPAHWGPGTVQAQVVYNTQALPGVCLSAQLEACGPARSARPATSKEPSCQCSEMEIIIRDFESGLGVFADDGAFAFGPKEVLAPGGILS